MKSSFSFFLPNYHKIVLGELKWLCLFISSSVPKYCHPFLCNLYFLPPGPSFPTSSFFLKDASQSLFSLCYFSATQPKQPFIYKTPPPESLPKIISTYSLICQNNLQPTLLPSGYLLQFIMMDFGDMDAFYLPYHTPEDKGHGCLVIGLPSSSSYLPLPLEGS